MLCQNDRCKPQNILEKTNNELKQFSFSYEGGIIFKVPKSQATENSCLNPLYMPIYDAIIP